MELRFFFLPYLFSLYIILVLLCGRLLTKKVAETDINGPSFHYESFCRLSSPEADAEIECGMRHIYSSGINTCRREKAEVDLGEDNSLPAV